MPSDIIRLCFKVHSPKTYRVYKGHWGNEIVERERRSHYEARKCQQKNSACCHVKIHCLGIAQWFVSDEKVNLLHHVEKIEDDLDGTISLILS